MAMSPGSRRRDNRTTFPMTTQDPAPLSAMQEPLGSMDRPIPRTSDDNDVNISSSGTGRSAGNLGTHRPSTRARAAGFTTTFAIIAAVLVAAFLIALYVGSDRTQHEPPRHQQRPWRNDRRAPPTTRPAAPDADAAAADRPARRVTDTGTDTGRQAPATGTGTGGGPTRGLPPLTANSRMSSTAASAPEGPDSPAQEDDPMCDYSLERQMSRPAAQGDRLMTTIIPRHHHAGLLCSG